MYITTNPLYINSATLTLITDTLRNKMSHKQRHTETSMTSLMIKVFVVEQKGVVHKFERVDLFIELEALQVVKLGLM